MAGHITARDPERTDHFWVNPFGMHFSQIRVSDLILVDGKGQVVEGDRPVNAAAFAIHSQVHHARPDVVAAAHAHSMYGKAWSTLGRLLDPITQDACAFYEDHGVFQDYTGVVQDASEGERIAGALGQKKAVILRNHGLLTVGESVDEAVWWFVTMDRSCHAQLLAEAAGGRSDRAGKRAAYPGASRVEDGGLVSVPAVVGHDHEGVAGSVRLRSVAGNCEAPCRINPILRMTDRGPFCIANSRGEVADPQERRPRH